MTVSNARSHSHPIEFGWHSTLYREVFGRDRRCTEEGCITILCYLNPGPRCFIHAAKANHRPPLHAIGSPEWTEAQDRAMDELLRLPPGWEAKVA